MQRYSKRDDPFKSNVDTTKALQLLLDGDHRVDIILLTNSLCNMFSLYNNVS